MASTNDLDIQALIADFVAAADLASMELPQLTSGQRKQAKKILEAHPDISCESYGFGQERRLHLFKVKPQGFLIDQQAEEQSRTALPIPVHDAPKCDHGHEVAKLNLAGIKDMFNRAPGSGHASAENSTTASSPCPSDGSPASTCRGIREVLPWFRLPPGLELEVHNTFIHYKDPAVNERTVQSMPHRMFRQSLLEEVASKQSAGHASKSSSSSTHQPSPYDLALEALSPGTAVIIDGLSKMPAFNGLSGTLQSFDAETGRYNILFSVPVAGHKSAKVKRENFRLVTPSETLGLAAANLAAPRALSLNALV